MKIKKAEVDLSSEDQIITGCIISDQFLKNIFPILDHRLFSSKRSKKIIKWVKDYYLKYEKAPKKDIQDIFQVEKKFIDDDEAELIEDILIRLSDNVDSYDSKFKIEVAENYIAEQKINRLIEEVHGNVLKGRINDAEALIASHTRTERPTVKAVDVLTDTVMIKKSLEDDSHRILLEFKGALGEMIGPLKRQDFFSFIGPMKRGKSFWMIDFAIKGILRQKKVLFVSMEMAPEEMMQRFYSAFTGSPKTEREIDLPYFDDRTIAKKSVKKEGLSSNKMIKKAEKLKLLIKRGGLQLLCYPTYGANVRDIKTEIHNLAHYNDFYPDIIIIDYADILAPEIDSPKDHRHRLNHTWGELRGLAQSHDALVITASQADRSTFKKDIEEDNLSEDIRKLAHVTHMMALNQNRDDKKEYLMRCSMLASRSESFQVSDEVYCLYQYAIGKPNLYNRWKDEVIV